MISDKVLDFETASAVDLEEVGAWVYAEHPTTEVLCLSYEDRDGVHTWHPGVEKKFLNYLIEDPDILFVSHGSFEKAIWRRIMMPVYGFPDIPDERWHDIMASAAMKQLPLKLKTLLEVLGLPGEKDAEGSMFTRQLSKPNKKTGMLDRSPETLARVYQYCESDVANERLVHNRLGWLQPGERRVWLLSEKINQRGIMIDTDYVRACQKVVDGALEPLAAEFDKLTGGLTITQRDKIMDWCRGRGVGSFVLPDLRKETIAELIGKGVDADEEESAAEPVRVPGPDGVDGGHNGGELLPFDVRRALTIRQLAGSSSIKKLGAMLACAGADSRARDLLLYHRAGPGRWAGRLLQPQNFPRPSLKDEHDKLVPPEEIVGALMTGDWRWVEMMCGPAIQTVVSGLRHALKAAKGHAFVSGDFAQIEARIVLALAGQHDKVKLFETGTPYVDMAEKIYGRPISKKNDIAEYTIGKNTVLGCGFQMGAQKFFDRYCPKQSLDFAEGVIRIYRKEWAPLVPEVWYSLERAASAAVWSEKPHEAYGVEYKLEDGWLTARLPSGRKLYYWSPRREEHQLPWDVTQTRPGFSYLAQKQGQIKTIHAFGGLLTENVVQALARDVLVDAMFKLEANGFPLVLTVHDEALAEVPENRVDEKLFAEVMRDRPKWAVEMKVPIGVETWVGDRYRK